LNGEKVPSHVMLFSINATFFCDIDQQDPSKMESVIGDIAQV
jgi:hypothetical protein